MSDHPLSCQRRQFLSLGAAGLAAGSFLTAQAQAQNEEPARSPEPTRLIDTNVYLDRWPFRRIRNDEPQGLVAMLRQQGVVQAWAGSFSGVFYKDLGAVNRSLAETCRRHGDGLLVPFGSVNPKFPDWEEELRRCVEVHRMPGIRLHPNYHGYTLDDPDFVRLMNLANERQLIVQLVPWLEDDRHHHPQMPIASLDLAPLPELLAKLPELKLILLNGFRSVGKDVLIEVLKLPNVTCDFALLDVINGLEDLLEKAPAERICFGSYSPMFYFESAKLKMAETVLTQSQLDALCYQNAEKLLPSVDPS